MDDTDQTKLFVGGISWETNEQVLRDHFSRYGTVLSSVIARDRETGSPRGFAFVTFSDSSAADRALQDSHEILSRTVEVKRAIPRGEHQDNRGFNRNSRINGRENNDEFRTKKVFVGGLSANLTEEEFRGYFEQFGRIIDVVVMHDNVTQRPRGFGFISFDSEDSVNEVMRRTHHELAGKVVEVKRAVPKDGMSSGRNSQNGRQVCAPEVNSYQNGVYAPFASSFGYVPGYVPGYPYAAGMFGGGLYPGVYGGFGYGLPPNAVRGVWPPSMPGVGGNFVPYYGAATMYPAYLNGALGMQGFANGYNGNLGAGFGGNSTPLGGDGQSTVESTLSNASKNIVEPNAFDHGRNSDSAGQNSVTGNDESVPDSNSR